MDIFCKAQKMLEERDKGWLRTGLVKVDDWVLSFELAHGKLHCIIRCFHCGEQAGVLGPYPQCFHPYTKCPQKNKQNRKEVE